MEKGIWQLKKLVLHYSTSDHSSKGMRDFILGITSSQVGSSGGLQSPLSLAAFALANPQLAIDAKAHANRAPRVVGEYADGSTRVVDVKNKTAAEIAIVVQRARDSASGIGRKYTKPVITQSPSVQGVWDPSVTYEGFSIREAKLR
jgi:hypothetical protein